MISVVVPVYNVEQYLERCIKSLSEQTYKDVEIILVDDGATDNSGRICDEWGLKDSRIVVIHQENKGLSGARNTGMEKASGEYLLFVDSDDFVEKDYVLKMAEEAVNNHSDIVFCNYRFVDESGEKIFNNNYSSFYSEKILDGNDVLELFEDKSFKTFFDVCWNKLYRRELFENVKFPEGISVIEDISVMPLIYHKAKRVSFVEEVLYNYVLRDGSLSHRKYSVEEDSKLRIPMMEERLQWYKEWGNKELCLVHLIHMYSLYEKVKEEYKDRRKELGKEYRRIYLFGNGKDKIKYVNNIPGSRKFKLFVAFWSMRLYSFLTKMK